MSKSAALACFLILIASITGCGTDSPRKAGDVGGRAAADGPLTLFAAASATNALDEIAAAYTKSTGTEVRTSYAASSALAQQIASGADADLFLSADLKWADYVQSKAPVARRRNLLGNRLVIVVPSDSKLEINRPADLVSDDVKHLALGDPDSVPAGRYAKQALTGLGLWEGLGGRVVPAADVRQALSYVETGAAEAGIVYATDAAVSKKVRLAVEIPAEATGPVLYPLLLLKRTTNRLSAEDFYNCLGSPEATAVFEKYGFIILRE